MPYRNLPDTDVTLSTALQRAEAKALTVGRNNLAFKLDTLTRLQAFNPVFAKEVGERSSALSVQTDATKARKATEEKCRLYTSHFYQVFNLGIARNEFKVTDRAYFQVPVSQESIPDLSNESSLVFYAKAIVTGEQQRTAAGAIPMKNPSAAEVETVLNEYQVTLSDQSTKKDNYEKEQRDVDNIRSVALELVKDIWDEVEFTFRKDSPSVMRRKAREYGVVYASRPDEPDEEDTLPGDDT